MNSCLYEGRVIHSRRVPVPHAFQLPLHLFYLDLAELDRVFAGRWLYSTRRPAFARFHRADHLGDPSRPLADCVREVVARHTGSRPEGPIRLLTQLRSAGYAFNPASFYYCFAPDGERVEAVAVHVTNTPWNERHTYVVPAALPGAPEVRGDAPKDFHVSPFMGMDVRYRFAFACPGESLSASIENRDERGALVFDARLQLVRQPITTRTLARALVRRPLPAVRTTAAIYWQALRLFLKRAPFHSHPEAA